MSGGPCHLISFSQCSGDLIFLREQLVYSAMEKVNISEFVPLRMAWRKGYLAVEALIVCFLYDSYSCLNKGVLFLFVFSNQGVQL